VKARGTRGGILLSIEGNDTAEAVSEALETHQELLAGKVAVEVTDRIPTDVIDLIRDRVAEAAGELTDIRPPTAVMQAGGETVIVAKTVRSGGRIESSGSVVILGDVNAGAEIIANDDIVVVGALRGLAHAGAAGNEKAVIWASQILSPQLRIGNSVAQAGVMSEGATKPEVAHLRDGQIVLRPWT
jgi:septum site-determining protein MinC